MIGAVPPAAIIDRLSSSVLLFDAAGLALFAVSGAGKALAFGAGPVAATLLIHFCTLSDESPRDRCSRLG